MKAAITSLLQQLKDQQHQDHLAMQQLMNNFAPYRSETTNKGENAEVLIEALAANITEFHHDEHNLTFDMWYSRYEDLFSVDAVKLVDAAKVRLLLRKLKPMVHSKYINYILPKHARAFLFKETVEKLQKNSIWTSNFAVQYKI